MGLIFLESDREVIKLKINNSIFFFSYNFTKEHIVLVTFRGSLDQTGLFQSAASLVDVRHSQLGSLILF